MKKLINYLEIVKYLNSETYSANPLKFNELLEKFETPGPAFNKDNFLAQEKNAAIFLSYIFVRYNWVMFGIASNNPDLGELISLVAKLEVIKGKFSNPMTNFYVNTMYVMLSSVSLYYSDKSNEALAQFNISMAEIIHTASTFWLTDYNAEYMESKTPQVILNKSITSPQCNSGCGDCTCHDTPPTKRSSTPTSEVSNA
jgi:hypothetical protein